ncbi:MAG: oxidoreductase C-terminal domain-containing protein, partial [Actinomycetota bacterium]|nr:oxidoreductase C-terminal domain-containing protein [Actinomycetota bacterium]
HPENSNPYDSVPFVWSDQYEDRIQVAGDTIDFDEVKVLTGSMDDRAFVAGYRLGTSLAGVVALNNMRAFVQFRRLLMTHGSWVDAVGLSEELGK